MDNVTQAASAVAHSHGFLALVAQYESWKLAIASFIGIDDWLLHTQFGMLLFVAAVIGFRRPLGSAVPVALVVAAEALNEWFDRLNYGSWRWPDTSRDLIFTIGWPLILFLAARAGLVRSR